MNDFLEAYIETLLHIDEATKNKLIDLEAGNKGETYYLTHAYEDAGEYALKVLGDRKGRVGNTVLRGSARTSEQSVGPNINSFDWHDGNGEKNADALNKFIDGIYKELSLKGNNSLFLCVGALKWRIAVSSDCVKDVLSPLLIFPIRLVRATPVTPVSIEFVDDDAYFNPCLIRKIEQLYGKETAFRFPHPNGEGQFNEPLLQERLGTGKAYFDAVERYVQDCARASGQDTVFSFDRNTVAIAHYNHSELCTYYDIRRNIDAVYDSVLVKRAFCEGGLLSETQIKTEPRFVLDRDSVQEDIVRRVVSGESLVIKGPPGTGKTQTIVNMLSALLCEGKKVLLSSKKLAALGEVYAKLPDKIRKFVMLLDAETEAQAAKLSPQNIKRDFSGLLDERRKYSPRLTIERERNEALLHKTEATKFLLKYCDLVFGNEAVLGEDYYRAVSVFLKNEDLPQIDFAEPHEVLSTAHDAYITLLGAVKEGEKCYNVLTRQKTHPVRLSPWFGAHDAATAEEAYRKYGELVKACKKVTDALRGVFGEANAGLSDLPIVDIAEIVRGGRLDAAATEKLLSTPLTFGDFSETESLLAEYSCIKNPENERKVVISDLEEIERLWQSVDALGVDGALCEKDIDALIGSGELFEQSQSILSGGEFLDALNAYYATIRQHEKEYEAYIFEAEKIFTKEVFAANEKLFASAQKALQKYTEGDEKPKLFDFGGKSALKKLRPLSYLGEASFAEVVASVRAYACAAAQKSEIERHKRLACQLFHRNLDEAQINALFLLLSRASATALTPAAYFEKLKANHGELKALFACAAKAQDCTVRDLLDGIYARLKLVKMKKTLERYFAQIGLSVPALTEPEPMARFVTALRHLLQNEGFFAQPLAERVRCVEALSQADDALKETVSAFLLELKCFGADFFENHYTHTEAVTLGDLAIFEREAADRDVVSAALAYFETVQAQTHALPLSAYFSYFVQEDYLGEASIAEIFEHSFYGLALSAYADRMGRDRNGLGRLALQSLQEYAAAEQKISEADILLIERLLMEKLNPSDVDFAFLGAERNNIPSLRFLFKKYAQAILKLKSCFILSPSTVSVLFRPDAYADFDVVIIDEASQLEPVCLLPLLFRARQCVIVGDEWQMPPIKHFAARGANELTVTDGDETFVLEPEASALTLALKNCNFGIKELQCHYRSKTESLIAFSQKRFYPYMKTFPAAVPIDDGLGFEDIYVEDGRCDDGVNAAEADCVVNAIKAHFDRYYDADTKQLRASIGVVAFGEKQIKAIEKKVEQDHALQRKINDALNNFPDVPEKLVFFKTIETVQGQETEHLILSITYGKTADGKVTNSFGQLNRDKLGQCIFNVAVTRAQRFVTVIHSVLPTDITSENVSYIREYLTIAQEFSEAGKDQFVSQATDLGFLHSVARYLEAWGIEKERIVFNYGVTEGSVRIPIAVLSKDLRKAELGIWCETPFTKENNYLDYNMRYAKSLTERGWVLHRIYAHDWLDNGKTERENLSAVLKQIIK